MEGLKRFLSPRQNRLALCIIGFYLAVAVAAPWLAPPDDPKNPTPFKVVGKSSNTMPQPPRAGVPLGTAPRQLDIYYTLVWGTRSALRFGLTVALSTALLGVLIGAFSGYVGGAVDALTMRVTDAFLTFPVIAGVWLFQQVLKPPSIYMPLNGFQQLMTDLKLHPITLTLILFSWMGYARIVNANVTYLKHSEYVVAARSIGAGSWRIISRHLLPNAIAPAIVLLARDIGAMVILESAFNFIGMGGSTEWGTLLTVGRDYIIGMGGNPLAYWWVFLPATLTLIFFGLGWNLLGDGLNHWLNPRTSR